MFAFSKFNQDISNWDVRNVKDHKDAFRNSDCDPDFRPKFKE